MNRMPLLLGLLLVAGCARSEDAAQLPGFDNGARSVETVRPERDDEEPAIGEWRETIQNDSRALEFGPSGAPPLFSLGCDDRRALILQRHGIETTGDLPVMLVTVGSETRRLAATPGEGTIPMMRATLATSDALAVNIGRGANVIEIRMGDSPPLIMRPSPLLGTYIGQCQSGAAATPAAPVAANGNAAMPAAPANVATPVGNGF